MKWEDFRGSDNVVDVRGSGGGGGMIGGGGLGIGAMIILGVIGYFLGIDPRILIGGATVLTGGMGQSQPAPQSSGPPTDETGRFVSAVLAQTEDVFKEILPAQKGVRYVAPKLVLFSGATRSACGAAQSAMGPFYCPADGGVYLDTSFFQQIDQMTGGRDNDFAYAYVVAHEIGHHIQNITGVADKVRTMQNRVSQEDGNALQIRMELQADCYAGIWANKNAVRMDAGDVEEGMRAAHAIGDDKLMRDAGRAPVESMFTHGTSEQRMAALKQGLRSGNPNSCNYFSGIF